MTLENLLSHIGTGTKQMSDRYSEYAGPVHDHDHQVYYAYEPAAPAHGHVASSKHNYGGGHKSSASMSALTLLAFLFFLHILQQCIKDHMTDMSATQPVVVMSAGREGEEAISKSDANKMDKTGITHINGKPITELNALNENKLNKKITDLRNPYDYDDTPNKKQLLKVQTSAHTTKSDQQKYKYAYNNNANRSSYFSGFISAMDEQ